MGEVVSFQFEDAPIRVVHVDDAPWFVAADICRVLGLVNPSKAVSRLDADEKGLTSSETLGGAQSVIIVSESGLYTLILRCRDAVTTGSPAHRFRKWVTAEVLPAIRRTGRYDDPAPLHRHSLTDGFETDTLASRVAAVEAARRIFGRRAARDLWVQLDLPTPARSPAVDTGNQIVDGWCERFEEALRETGRPMTAMQISRKTGLTFGEVRSAAHYLDASVESFQPPPRFEVHYRLREWSISAA